MSALPVAAEVNRWPALHRQTDNTVRLLAVADAAEVLPPGCLLGIAKEIRPGDMVVMPELATAQAGEIGLRRIGASTADAHMGGSRVNSFQLMVSSIPSPVADSDPRSEPVARPAPVPAHVSNSHTVAVHHDDTTIPLATGKAQAGETNL